MLELLRYAPVSLTDNPPLLFVHGAWHGAWCWEDYFLPYYQEQGFMSYALSLRGHGNSSPQSVRWCSVWDYVADVRQQVELITAECGEEPILIGHSMGGYVLQKYLERHPARGIVLLASIPVMGMFPAFLRIAWRHPLAFMKAGLTMRGYPLVENPDHARELFFSEGAEKTYHEKLEDESYRIVYECAFFQRPNPKRVHPTRMLVLAAENDRIFTVYEQTRTAEAYQTDVVILPNTAHDVMLEPTWRFAADRILMFLEEERA